MNDAFRTVNQAEMAEICSKTRVMTLIEPNEGNTMSQTEQLDELERAASKAKHVFQDASQAYLDAVVALAAAKRKRRERGLFNQLLDNITLAKP